jgi:hypothetical protein
MAKDYQTLGYQPLHPVVWIKWCIIVFAGTEYKGHFTWVVK